METHAQGSKPEGAKGDATGEPRVTYSPRPDATPEGELTALAAVYSIVLQAHERRVATSRDEGKGESTGDAAGPWFL